MIRHVLKVQYDTNKSEYASDLQKCKLLTIYSDVWSKAGHPLGEQTLHHSYCLLS